MTDDEMNAAADSAWAEVTARWRSEGRKIDPCDQRPENHRRYGARLTKAAQTVKGVREAVAAIAELVEREVEDCFPGAVILVRSAPLVLTAELKGPSDVDVDACVRARFGFRGVQVRETARPVDASIASPWPEGEALPERST